MLVGVVVRDVGARVPSRRRDVGNASRRSFITLACSARRGVDGEKNDLR